MSDNAEDAAKTSLRREEIASIIKRENTLVVG